mgnify:CR=1 FL=1
MEFIFEIIGTLFFEGCFYIISNDKIKMVYRKLVLLVITIFYLLLIYGFGCIVINVELLLIRFIFICIILTIYSRIYNSFISRCNNL